MPYTYLELLTSSLRLCGQLAPGRGAAPSQLEAAKVVLNGMLDAWNSDGLVAYRRQRTTHTLTASQASYTIGTDGTPDFDAARPHRIERAGIILAGADREYPIEVAEDARWARVSDKVTTGTPYLIYYDADVPNGTIHIVRVPAAADTLVLYSWLALSSVGDETETVDFPPGYFDAIRYNLGSRLGLEWGFAQKPGVEIEAAKSLARIKRHNVRVAELECDEALLNREFYQ